MSVVERQGVARTTGLISVCCFSSSEGFVFAVSVETTEEETLATSAARHKESNASISLISIAQCQDINRLDDK